MESTRTTTASYGRGVPRSKIRLIVICSLTIALQKCLMEPTDSPTKEQIDQRKESLHLLSKMAELEKVSARKFMKCTELLKKATEEPMKSM